MGCEHKRFGCRNNVFFCLDCGAEIDNPYVKNVSNDAAEEKKVEQDTKEKQKTTRKKGAAK